MGKNLKYGYVLFFFLLVPMKHPFNLTNCTTSRTIMSLNIILICVCVTQPLSDGSCRSLCGADKYTGWALSKFSPDDPHWSPHFSQPPAPTEPETQENITQFNIILWVKEHLLMFTHVIPNLCERNVSMQLQLTWSEALYVSCALFQVIPSSMTALCA